LVIIVDVVVEINDIDEMALIELARDNITRGQSSTRRWGDQFKIPLG